MLRQIKVHNSIKDLASKGQGPFPTFRDVDAKLRKLPTHHIHELCTLLDPGDRASDVAYPPGECRLVVLNLAGDLNAARKNGIKDGNEISSGDHHGS